MIALFLGAVLLGLPVSFAMLLSTLVYLQVTDAAPFIAVPQNMIDGTGNFILLALPFFIFAGLIMERGGISLRLVRFAMALVGRARGGLLQVIVVTIYMVSGISGSKVADVAAVGSVMRGELRRRGYRPDQGAAVLGGLRGHGGDDPTVHRDAGAGVGDADLDRDAVRRRAAAGGGDRGVPDAADLRAWAAVASGI